MDNTMIPLSTLRKLPPKNTIIGVEKAKGMDGIEKDSLLVIWTEYGSVRKANFALSDGEYLGDRFLSV